MCGDEAGSYGGYCSFSGCSNSGSIYGKYAGGLCGVLAGNVGGTIIIKNNSINKGLIKFIKAGQLFGSITTNAKLIEIDKNTIVLKPAFDNPENTTNLNIPKTDFFYNNYQLIGDSNYNFIITIN